MTNKHVIKIGDYVKIVHPEIFVRCGYPLTPYDFYNDAYNNYEDNIDEFIKGLNLNLSDIDRSKFKGVIAHQLAYVLAKQNKFGGNKRTIYTEKLVCLKEIKNEQFKVQKINYVKTGTRVEPTYNMYTYDNDDYVQPYLTDIQTHKILTLYTKPSLGRNIKIEDVNVELCTEHN